MTVGLPHLLALAAMLFGIGLYGALSRKNAVHVMMSLELMANAVNINLVAFSRQLGDLTGQVLSVFVIVVAAGEAAIGLAIVLSIYRLKSSVNLEDAAEMRG